MKNLFTKKDYRKIIVLTAVALLLFLCAAPHIIRTTVTSKNKVAYDKPVTSVAHGYTLSQQFIPQYDTIKNIEIYIHSGAFDRTQGYLHVSISDALADIVYEEDIPLSELPEYGRTAIAENITLKARNLYALSIESVGTVDDGPAISFYPTATAASTEETGAVLTYAGLPLENSVLRASFYYDAPLSPVNYVPYCLFIAFIILFCGEYFHAHRHL